MEYVDFSAGQAGPQDAAEDVAVTGAQPVQQYNHLPSSYAPDQSKAAFLGSNFGATISCDIKPRLTKEQHDILEAHFQRQHKPNTLTKKGYADNLQVSLDKVNNWFQNRRAKHKQDAKKKQGALNLYQGQQMSSSDSETSPGYVDTSSQYHAMMQHWSSDHEASNGLGISHGQHDPDHLSPHTIPLQSNVTGVASQGNPHPAHLHPAMYGNQEELNRRTLTQEQFDAMERDGGMVNNFGTFEDFETSFGGDHTMLSTIFPDADFKQHNVYNYPIGAPMSSYDSTVPSNVSAESLSHFPASTITQAQAGVLTSSPDWSDSRSSSLHEGNVSTMAAPAQPGTTLSSQWQPGQSVPVDSTQQAEEFRQIRTQAQARTSPIQQMHEPLAPWSDDAFIRRASSASLLAQSMSNVGIHTPPQHQNATFKSPAPPSNIAARRQRAPRPAALGVAALRSQSHSGAVPSTSPIQAQPQQVNPTEALRRIKSSNFLGNVAHGRIMKSTPGSAQRSPMHHSFAEAVHSPHFVRHMSSQSQGTLAPPTPLSPKDSPAAELTGQFQHWQSNVGNGNPPSSIAETTAEHGQFYQTDPSFQAQSWTSPPHTPMFHQHPVVQTRFQGNNILENTPPQSAPAGQSCFPSNVNPMSYAYQNGPQHVHPQAAVQPQEHVFQVAQPRSSQHFAHATMANHQYQMSSMPFVPTQQMNVPMPMPPQTLPLHFSNGVPLVNAAGELQMYFPQQMQLVSESQAQSHTSPTHTQTTPPQMTHCFTSSTLGSPSSQGTAPLPKTASDFFVHEYSPPESVKRAATPRRGPVETGPKNYAFAHTGPEHFEEKKSDEKKRTAKDSFSLSPASSNGTGLTS